jgi:hypothetical protein
MWMYRVYSVSTEDTVTWGLKGEIAESGRRPLLGGDSVNTSPRQRWRHARIGDMREAVSGADNVATMESVIPRHQHQQRNGVFCWVRAEVISGESKHLLSSEGAPHQQTLNCLIVIKIWSWPQMGLWPQDRLPTDRRSKHWQCLWESRVCRQTDQSESGALVRQSPLLEAWEEEDPPLL